MPVGGRTAVLLALLALAGTTACPAFADARVRHDRNLCHCLFTMRFHAKHRGL